MNFKDFSRSNRWNPLKEMYDEQMKILNIGKNVQVKNGKPDSEIKLMSIDYKDQYYEYQGMAFSSQDEVDAYANTEAFLLKSKISSLINSFCTTVIPPSNANDRTWEDGARGLLNGIIQCMLEEALNPERGFTAEMMSLKSVLDCFMLFREMSLSSSPYQDIAEDIVNFYLKDKPVEALNNIYNVLHTAPVTMKGFYSSFASLVNKWMQGHIFQLTSDTNFDLDDTSKPWAIFICTKDYDKSDNVIAGLFIDWVYRQCLNKSEELIQKNQPIRATHFLLDEFANIPKIPDFENKIATARSRNIWFHLYVQAYEQLDSVYGDKISKIIIDNCNVQVFLGSQSLDSKTKFSSECGKKNIVSVHGILTGNNAELTEVPVLPITALDLIKPGELYIKRIYEPVIKGEFIRSYQLALLDVFKYYHDKNAYKDIAPLNNASPNDSKHSYPLFNFRTYKIPYNIEDGDDDDDSTW